MKNFIILLVSIIIISSTYAYSKEISLIEDIIKRGVLRVGFTPTVPDAMKNKQETFIGFNIDIAKKLAQGLGVELQLIPTRWINLIPALLANKIDIIISGLTITLEHNLQVNFSIPYNHINIQALGNTKKIVGMRFPEDFNKPDVIVSLRNGSSSVEVAKRILPNASFRLFDDEVALVKDVYSGHSHVLFTAAPLTEFAALQSEGILTRLNITIAHQPVGFAIRKGDYDSINVLNNWISSINEDGWLPERKAYWFNYVNWEKQIKTY